MVEYVLCTFSPLSRMFFWWEGPGLQTNSYSIEIHLEFIEQNTLLSVTHSGLHSYKAGLFEYRSIDDSFRTSQCDLLIEVVSDFSAVFTV